MAFKDAHLRATGQIPQPQRAVVPTREHTAAVRAERHTPDPLGVTCKDAHLRAAGQVPQPQRVVIPTREHTAAVRAECDAPYRTAVAGKYPYQRRVGGVVERVQRREVGQREHRLQCRRLRLERGRMPHARGQVAGALALIGAGGQDVAV